MAAGHSMMTKRSIGSIRHTDRPEVLSHQLPSLLPACGAIMQTAKDPGVTLLRSRFKTDLTKWVLEHGVDI